MARDAGRPTAPSRGATAAPGGPGPFGRHGPHGMFGPQQRAANVRGTVGRLWQYLRREKAALVAAALIVLVTSGLGLISPYLLGQAIDQGIMARNLPALVSTVAWMFAANLAAALLTWLQGYVMVGAAQRTVQALRDDLFGAMQALPLRYYDTHAHGDLMSRVTNDVDNVSSVLTDSVAGIVASIVGLVGAAALMLVTNWRLALVSMAANTILTLFVTKWLAVRIRAGFREQQSALGDLNGLIEETVTGQRVVKAYHREAAAIAQFEEHNAAFRQAAVRAQTYSGFIGPLMNGSNNLGLAVVAGAGGLIAVHGLATVGTLAAFINYARIFGRPLAEMGSLYSVIQGAIAGAERVFEVMDTTPEQDAEDAVPLPSVRGDVVLENLDFAYDPETPVLRGVTLHARPGQVVALIGPTGAGKTTIASLLSRFYEVQTGRVLVDGHDIRSVRRADLRRQLGIVLQDTFIFSGTVRDNLRYGRLDAGDEEVEAAARAANAHSFIHRLPDGYETLLSERGSNLSQGQRQLLAIARAILGDPRILVLDEATSSVDTRTERHIQQAMRRLMEGRTSFVIAHRLSTIRSADQILVIDHGQVIERGTHDELMALQGFYNRLSTGRFGEVKDEETAPAN